MRNILFALTLAASVIVGFAPASRADVTPTSVGITNTIAAAASVPAAVLGTSVTTPITEVVLLEFAGQGSAASVTNAFTFTLYTTPYVGLTNWDTAGGTTWIVNGQGTNAFVYHTNINIGAAYAVKVGACTNANAASATNCSFSITRKRLQRLIPTAK
jgi:hypothetical protein